MRAAQKTMYGTKNWLVTVLLSADAARWFSARGRIAAWAG
jgi:hypothetical protein